MVEDGSKLATELWGEDLAVASSILSYPEGRAALAAAHRAGRLTEAQHAVAAADFEEVHRELLILGLDSDLAREAGRLTETFALRGYDAVHLAAALALDGGDTTLVSWDRELSRAASRSGLAVAPA